MTTQATLPASAWTPTMARAARARVQLAKLPSGGPGPLYTAVELAQLSDLDAIDWADALDLDLNYQPSICWSQRPHPAHGECTGRDADLILDRTQDALS